MSRLRTGRIAAAISGCVLTWFPAGFSYAQADEIPLDSSIGGGSVYWMMVKVFAFLAILIGLFLFVVRILAKRNRNLMSGRSVKALGGLPMGANKSVQVIQIGHSLYVVGVGNDITLLDKIDNGEEVEYIQTYFQPNGAGKTDAAFSTVSDWFQRFKHRDSNEEFNLSSSFQEVFHEKMKRLTNRQKTMEDLLSDEKYEDRLTDKNE